MNKSSNRIYGDKIDLNATNIMEFYNRRAGECFDGKKTRNTTVLLGDNNPEYADKWNKFEKEFVKPYLNIEKNHRVLDIGCGVGRWAESIMSSCGDYIGADFSGEMIKVASEHFRGCSNIQFINSSYQDLFHNSYITTSKFDTVIIAGVSMYVNDDELSICLNQLSEILNRGAIVYIEESVGIRERLTLNQIWSENLGDQYNAIYRTREEYLELLNGLLMYMDVLKEDYFGELDKKELSETSHWYIIMKKK